MRRLRTARTLPEIRAIAQQLGVIGDDRAIDEIRPLVSDPRSGVPDEILAAIGAIGSDHAVDVLLEHARDPRSTIREAAILALGATHNARAEDLLVQLATSGDGDREMMTAIDALGQLGTDRAVDALVELATTLTGDPARRAVVALGESESPAAAAALRRLVDSPSIDVASAAIAALTEIDDDMFAKLSALIAEGDAGLAGSALDAIAHAGERAVPILRDAALHGPVGMREAAVYALARVDGAEAVRALGVVMDTSDAETARTAARSLSELGTEDARDLLIASALSERRNVTGALQQLLSTRGSDVDQALLTIARSDRRERSTVLAALISRGNADAMQLATDLVTSGTPAERSEALEMFASAGTKAAAHALVDIARTQTGEGHLEALRLLARRAGDPEVARFLQDTLQSGKPEEAAAAAEALAHAGTTQARDALVAALSNGDDQLTEIAMTSLAQFRLTDDVSAALVAAAHANPELVPEVMRRLLSEGSKAGYTLAETALAAGGRDAISALDALGRAGTPGAIRLLEGAISAGDPELRRAALDHLGTLRAEGAEETVIGALRDPEASVRDAAVSALGSLGTANAKSALLALARTGTPDDKRAVVTSLRELDDPAVGQTIVGLVRDPDPDVALTAIEAAVARGADIDGDLTSIVRNADLPYLLRVRALHTLRNPDAVDQRLRDELDGDRMTDPLRPMPQIE